MATKLQMDDFYRNYESCWDYTHQVYDRGMMLQYFIKEKRPDFEWMFQKPEPAHISQIPEEIRDEYIQYLKEAIAELWDKPVDEVNYTDQMAAEEAWQDTSINDADCYDEEFWAKQPWRKTEFQIECGPKYEGYTKGEHWNGWACPRLTKEAALKLCADTDNGMIWYNEERDMIVSQNDFEDPTDNEEFEGKDIIVDGEVIHVYPVGAWSWIWDDCAEQEITDEEE